MKRDDFLRHIESLPEALQSRYGPLAPNHDVPLFDGDFALTRGEDVWPARGEVLFRWLPRPAIRFSACISAGAGTPETGRFGIEIPELDLKTVALITEVSHGDPSEPTPVSGLLADSRWSNPRESYEAVYFHLANFNRFPGANVRRTQAVFAARLSLEWRDYSVIIDRRPELREIKKEVRRNGGYGVGHIGRITSSGGDGISPNKARFLLRGLHWFCTFVRGIRCGPALVWAASTDGAVSEFWRSPDLDPRVRHSQSWFPELNPESLKELYPAFMDRFANREWREPLQYALEWYASANKQEAKLEGSHVQAVTGLEVLGSIQLSTDLDFAPVGDRIRKLLRRDPKIPTDIPTALTGARLALEEIGDPSNPQDGPEAIAQFRNKLVHPSQDNRHALGALASGHRLNLKDLALWYFELCFLRLLGYEGLYSNRLDRNRFAGESVPVPWAAREAG